MQLSDDSFSGSKVYQASKFMFLDLQEKEFTISNDKKNLEKENRFCEKTTSFLEYWLSKNCWFYAESSDKTNEVDPDSNNFYDLIQTF